MAASNQDTYEVLTSVVVIEDDQLTRVMLVDSLKNQGLDVPVASDKPSAVLDYCKATQVSAALIDLNLGAGPTGIDLAISLRRLNPIIGIVFLTSYQDPRLLRSGLPKLPRGSIELNKQQIG